MIARNPVLGSVIKRAPSFTIPSWAVAFALRLRRHQEA